MGETPVGILLWGLLGIIYFVFQGLLNRKSSSERHPVALVLVMLFYLGTFLSLFFTLSLPLTINTLVLMSLAVLSFDYFYHSSPSKLPIKFLMYGFLLIGLNISLLSAVFFFLPTLGAHLPGMNLLVSNFGHNHASVFYIFCIPIAILFIKDSDHKKYSYLPLAILLVSLLMSFARIDIVIGILEVALFWFILMKKEFNRKNFTLKKVLGVVCLLAAIGLVSVVKMGTGKVCFAASVNRQTCKEFTSDFRIQYWTQAFQAIREKPLLGWGGGTFTIISNQRAAFPYYFSSYAHNEYLQLLAEYGVLFSLPFFCLLIYVYSIATPRNLRFEQPSDFLFISFLALCVDGLFDFNLSYSVVWVLFFITMALPQRRYILAL
jgi:hypothetical protein